MTINANPLIKDDPSDTIDELCVRVNYIGQWAEGDESYRALQQEMQLMRGALLWLAQQNEAGKS